MRRVRLVARHNRCVGITLFQWKRRKLEVWFIPKDEVIEAHKHDHIDSSIRLLFGYMTGQIADVRGHVIPWRAYPVPAGMKHSAVTSTFVIFANWERWTGDAEVTSAAVDFTAV